MTQPDLNKARQYILERLRKELDPRLSYHNVHHTEDFVVPACERLAQLEGLTNEDTIIVVTAALYHDTGFLKQHEKNEPIGVEIASETLPGFGYTKQQIAIIQDIILATAVPQSPKTHLEEIMCDADLFHFGQDNLITLSINLWHELLAFGARISEQEWFEGTLDFLQSHNYFTKSANLLGNRKKEQNIEKVKRIIEQLKLGNE
jgi:predicted metal-dependent HD superfamily phosphohydrolase